MRLENKVMVVTGGSAGIGRELVLGAVHRGARVAAADMSHEALEGTVEIADAGERLTSFGIESDKLDIYVGRDSRTMSALERVAPGVRLT